MTPAPPRRLLVLAALALGGGLVMTFVGGWRTGVSWDETFHVLRLQNYWAHGWYLLDGDLDGNSPGSWEDQQYVYAPVTMLLLHGWSLLWGADTAGHVSATAHGYAVRHLGVGLVSVVGVAATAVLARWAVGGERRAAWGWGLLAAALLVAVPTWSGHAMFNVKDVSVATGYTLVTLGLAALASRMAWVPWAGVGVLLAGLVLAVGTRPGIAPGLAVAAGVTLLTRDRRRWVLVIGTTLLAALVLRLVYPGVFGNPVHGLVEGALSSSRFGDEKGAWWYLPLYLVIELPTLHLLLGGLGAWLAVRALRTADEQRRLVLALVLLQTFLLPGLALVRQSNIYTGIRQLLFAAPGLAVLVTLALVALTSWAAARPRWRVAAPWVAAAAVVLPLLGQLQLFPYGYAYRSPPANALAPYVAELDPVAELQTDYWRTSVRELAPSVPATGFVMCTPSRDDPADPEGGVFWRASRDGSDDCATNPVGPLTPYDDQRAGTPVTAATRWVAVATGTDRDATNCRRTAEVDRRLWFRVLTMSYVATCDLALEDYPADGLRFDGAGHDGQVWLGGWDAHQTRPGIGLAEQRASIGVTLPDDLRGQALRLTGSAWGAPGARVWVNGRRLPVTTTSAAYSARVPVAVAGRYGEGRLVITFGDTGGHPDLRLVTLHLEDA